MKRKFSVYHFLVVLMLVSLISPAFAGATGNIPTTGTLTIHKFEIEPDEEAVEDGDGSEGQNTIGNAVNGVTYTLTQTHAYNPTTDEWTEVSGTPATYTIVGDGKVVIPITSLGRYSVQETGWPDHVVPDETEYFVDIPMTSADGSGLNYDVHIYPKNETIRGSVTLTKHQNSSSLTLDGVSFNLYKKETDGPDVLINTDPLVTEDGIIFVDNLAFGDYYFIETATVDGYLVNGEEVEFSISSQGQEATVHHNNYQKPEVEKEVDEGAVNREETVTYTITLQLPEDIQSYNYFNVTDVLNEHLQYVENSATVPTGFTFAFDETTQTLTWTGEPEQLTPGEVDITFAATVKSSAPTNEEIINEVEIDFDNGYEEDSGKDEVPVFVHAGSLTVKKIDRDTEEGLDGAVFELRDSDGNLIATGTSVSTGNVVFDNPVNELPFGNYTLTETQAPADYRLLLNPIEFTINEDQSVHEITVENFKSGWELPRTGGIGTMLFTLVGLSLMGTAGVIFTRRKKGEQV